jgi:signal transduction histidine kinase/CheY-like chemotaxis protein
MLAPIYREALAKYYERTYRDQRSMRFVSIAMVAILTAYLGVWPAAVAVIWCLVYMASEIALVIWWRRILPILQTSSQSQVVRFQSQLIIICALSCAVCAIPCFLTLQSSPTNRIIAVVLSAGIILVGAAVHSLRRNMFLLTTPVPFLAMALNLFSLGQGLSSWLLLFIGVCYYANARMLQLSNANVFNELVRLQVEAELANRAKTEFLATMSHEIRTPLNGVLGIVQIMERSELAPEQREQLAVIANSGQTLLSVLNGVLDLSKIESGQLELETHPFDLAELMALVAAPFETLTAQKEIVFEVRISPEALGVWRGDSAKLRQVLSNLLSNALKFTTEGRITVSVDAVTSGLFFSVQDTGIGVAVDKLDMIFEKFTQADASTSRRFGGTGLGLAICRRYVALMGGELSVTSQTGQGARFSFNIPLERASEPVAHEGYTSVEREAGPERALRILAAEDNPTNQLILRALLTPLQLELVLVADGEAAVAVYQEGGFDLVLMDIQMPGMDGVEATRQIRQYERQMRRGHTPILALTANVMPHQLEAYLSAGMDGFVAKPIQLSALTQAIESALMAEA